MKISKKILILILSLIFLVNPITLDYCLATGPPTGTGKCSVSYEEDYPNHHEPTCNDESLCPTAYHCCNLATMDAVSYAFTLDFYTLNLAGIFFHPSKLARSLYHPPRTHS